MRLIVKWRDPVPPIAALASDPFVTVTGFVEDIPALAGRLVRDDLPDDQRQRHQE